MRPLLVASALLLLSSPASALCRCVCVLGVMKPICQPTDLVEPICQGLCMDEVRPPLLVKPLAGGQPQFTPVAPSDPAPGRVVPMDSGLETNPNGQLLGTPNSLSGSVGSSLSNTR